MAKPQLERNNNHIRVILQNSIKCTAMLGLIKVQSYQAVAILSGLCNATDSYFRSHHHQIKQQNLSLLSWKLQNIIALITNKI